MKKQVAVSFVALAVGLCGCAARRPGVTVGQPGVGVTRVVLFQSGMAYFERRGAVSGNELDLVARRDSLDDVLKSLTVVDGSGGRVASVRVLPAPESAPVVTVRVGLAGSERGHDVAMSYMAPATGWRPTYRLVVQGNDTVRVQGFAVLDNRSGESWRDVSLALSTELPVSFEYEVHTPRLPSRPHFTSDGRLRPPSLAPAVEGAANPQLAVPAEPAFAQQNVQAAYALANIAQPEISSRAGRVVGARIPTARVARPEAAGTEEQQTPGQLPLEVLEEHPTEQGFLLESPARFTLGNDESGMVPFVDTSTAGSSVLLFKPATASGPSSHRMYRAVLFQNPLDAPLMTGPVAVYADGRFAGDAVSATIPQRTHAFVSYALDTSVEVRADNTTTQDELRATALSGGFLTAELTQVHRHRFTLDAPQAWRQQAYVFVASEPGFEPRALPQGTVVTGAGVYVPVATTGAHAEASVDLVQRQTPRVNIAADPNHAYVPALLELLARRPEGAALVPRLREIYTTTTRLREEQEQLDRDIEVFRRASDEHRASLDALRSVPANGALRARIAARLGENVARADELTRRRVAASAEQVALRGEWYAQLRSLTVQGGGR